MTVPLEVWMHAVAEAAGEVAATSLGYAETRVLEMACPGDAAWMGAAILVTSRDGEVHLGLLSDPQGCERLAKALLGMEPEEALPAEDMADSLREIVNILAGGAKKRVIQHDDSLKLGLPTFVDAVVHASGQPDAAEINMSLGPVTVRLRVTQTAGRN